MSDEKVGYARREFLGQCFAAPVAAKAILSGSAVVASETPSTVAPQVVARNAVDLEREVESLLKLVDPQVVYRRVPVPAEKNAWPLWKKANDAYVKQPEDEEFAEMIWRLLEGGEFPTGELKGRLLEWVEKNAECRRIMDDGITLGALELPRSCKAGALSLALDEIDLFRTFTQLRFLTSRTAVEKSDFQRAASEAYAGMEFARTLLASECMIVDFLVGIAILGTSINAVYEFSMAAGVPEPIAREAIKRLVECRVGTKVFKQAYRVEYCRWILPFIASFPDRGTIEELVKHYFFGLSEPAPDYKPSEKVQAENDRAVGDITFLLEDHENAFDKQATARLGSDFYLRLFQEIEKGVRDRGSIFMELRNEISAWPEEAEPDAWMDLDDSARPERPKKSSRRELRRARDQLRKVDNPLGKRLLADYISGTGHYVVEQNYALVESTRLRIALKLYERKHGRLPETLAALVDDGLLPEVPKDPIDGKEFKYSRDRRVIWSIGTEGTNDGVIQEPEDPEEQFNEGLEMTWRI